MLRTSLPALSRHDATPTILAEEIPSLGEESNCALQLTHPSALFVKNTCESSAVDSLHRPCTRVIIHGDAYGKEEGQAAMRPEDVYRILHQQPFQPVRVHLTDGRSYDIHHPHQAVVGKTFFDIGIAVPSLPEGIYERVESLDPADIARVEPLGTTASPVAPCRAFASFEGSAHAPGRCAPSFAATTFPTLSPLRS
jgi:hypothetical protein